MSAKKVCKIVSKDERTREACYLTYFVFAQRIGCNPSWKAAGAKEEGEKNFFRNERWGGGGEGNPKNNTLQSPIFAPSSFFLEVFSLHWSVGIACWLFGLSLLDSCSYAKSLSLSPFRTFWRMRALKRELLPFSEHGLVRKCVFIIVFSSERKVRKIFESERRWEESN